MCHVKWYVGYELKEWLRGADSVGATQYKPFRIVFVLLDCDLSRVIVPEQLCTPPDWTVMAMVHVGRAPKTEAGGISEMNE